MHHLAMPNGKTVGFAGKPGDIWHIFILLAACAYAGTVHWALQLLVFPATILFYWLIMRWFWPHVTWPGRAAPLAFTGSYWGLLGWTLLTALAFITIIGWAWVMTATFRWVCRHIEGSSKKLVFVAGDCSMLWRMLLFGLLCALIIPIPWMLRWYTRWVTAQFHLVARA